MSSNNNITIVGIVGGQPELKVLQSGVKITNFSVAVRRSGKNDVTDWFNCISFNGTAEHIARYFNKGSWISVQGEMQFDKYTDTNGSQRIRSQLKVDSVNFVGSRQDNLQQVMSKIAKNPQVPPTNINVSYSAPTVGTPFEEVGGNDELPF